MSFAKPLANTLKTPSTSFSLIDFDNPVNSNFIGIGVAQAPIGKYQPGKIRINANRWSALNVDDDTIPVGGEIRVVGRQNLTLYVQSTQRA